MYPLENSWLPTAVIIKATFTFAVNYKKYSCKNGRHKLALPTYAHSQSTRNGPGPIPKSPMILKPVLSSHQELIRIRKAIIRKKWSNC